MKKSKKIPIQIYLDPDQDKILAHLSRKSRKSKAALIRSCITKVISSMPVEEDPVLNIIGLGASGEKDIAQRHDDYLNRLKRSK